MESESVLHILQILGTSSIDIEGVFHCTLHLMFLLHTLICNRQLGRPPGLHEHKNLRESMLIPANLQIKSNFLHQRSISLKSSHTYDLWPMTYLAVSCRNAFKKVPGLNNSDKSSTPFNRPAFRVFSCQVPRASALATSVRR